MKRIALFGSTGSIGKSTLSVVRHFSEDFSVSVLVANTNIELLFTQVQEFQPELVVVYDEKRAIELRSRLPFQRVVSGEEGLEEAAKYSSVDFVVMAIVGMAALRPTLWAIQSGKTIGLANKEVLVAAGALIKEMAKKHRVSILPIDSEHSALFQCLDGKQPAEVSRLILTASGGPFRLQTQEELAKVTVQQALDHPTWNMGPKVTIDSSTLVNKGLEVIEAHWLFEIPPENIEVVIHPQSIIHSCVEFIDGSILAQLSEPDMVYPIQYALTYPRRKKGMFPPFDFIKNSKLEFLAPDHQKFPALELAFESLSLGGSASCYFNAANEVLVARFLREEISWLDITVKLEKLLSRHQVVNPGTIETVFAIDKQARKEARIV